MGVDIENEVVSAVRPAEGRAWTEFHCCRGSNEGLFQHIFDSEHRFEGLSSRAIHEGCYSTLESDSGCGHKKREAEEAGMG